jgi:uncharacterized protein YdaU (DUF1376 family)
MARAPYIQFYVSDYIGSTGHLTTEQHGAYLLLLFAMWNAGGSLPSDPAKLARIVRLSPRRWQAIAPDILEFFRVDGDRITQERLRRDYDAVVEIGEKRSAAGKLGNAVKSLKSKEPDNANALANQTHTDRISESYSEPEPNSEPEASAEPDSTTSVTAPQSLVARSERIAGNEIEEAFEEFWPQCPRKVGKGTARRIYLKIVTSGKATPAALLHGMMRYAQEREGQDPKYTQHPATWLNAEGWLNEPAPVYRQMTKTDAMIAGVLGWDRDGLVSTDDRSDAVIEGIFSALPEDDR